MRKWIPIVLGTLLILLLCSYFILPGSVSIYHRLPARVYPLSLQRGLADASKWKQWWPGEASDSAGVPHLRYNGYTYTLKDRQLTTLVFDVRKGGFAVDAALNFIPTDRDSVEFSWVAEKRLPTMPAQRLQAYRHGRQLDKDLEVILGRMSAFYTNPDHIYTVPIREALVVDSLLVSTYATVKGYPSMEFVYGLIDQLKAYTAQQGAKETGNPMLNVSTQDSIHFLTRVAIPVNRRLPTKGNISFKWMLGGGNILITEVKGGPTSLAAAYRQIDLYVSDHRRVAPAIPFESLVTDRRQVKDTAQWVTRIYYPVM